MHSFHSYISNEPLKIVEIFSIVVLLMPLAETIKEFVSFILKGVDLIDHTSIFLLRTINHYVTLIMCTLS